MEYQKLIHYTRMTETIPEFDMLPGELAYLCGRQHLSDMHIMWIAQKLNSMQSSAHVVFLNFITDIETYCERRAGDINFCPSKLVFMLNVGLNGSEVFIARERSGCHFSIAVCEDDKEYVIYGDSLGWSIPHNLLDLINRYTRIIFEKEFETIVECHVSAQTAKQVHICNTDCLNYYPLQKDGDVCGIVVSVIASIVSLSPVVWDYITSVKKSTESRLPYYFIQEPTKYNKYLRSVLIVWFMKNFIDVEYVVPRYWLFGDENHDVEEQSSDSDSDIDVIRMEDPLDQIKEEEPSKKMKLGKDKHGQFACPSCPFTCSRSNNLKRHVQRKHPDLGLEEKSKWKCFCYECKEKFFRISDMKDHLSIKHGYKFAKEKNVHNSVEEFKEWKEELEREHGCSFVVARGQVRKQDGETVQYYTCNRSGIYKPKRDKKRRTKSSGTRKIDNNCTASMKVTIKEGQVTSDTCLTHYGHEVELQHLNLPKGFRQEIAAKLKQGVKGEKIIDDVRDNVGMNFKREHMLEEQDLRNIAISFGVANQRHANDQESVLSWIEEWRGSDKNPVLYYKTQGTKDDHEHRLEADDFIIILQTKDQCNLMLEFARKGVCCDTTHGTTGYDFKLATLMVLDEFQEGVPVAHCLGNKETYNFMELFFEKLVENGDVVSPVYFMSDTATQFYDAFSYVNGCQPISLFCTWHVDKAWRENLRSHIASSQEVVGEVYKYLRAVLEQTDQKVFESDLANMTIRLN